MEENKKNLEEKEETKNKDYGVSIKIKLNGFELALCLYIISIIVRVIK